MEAGIIPEHFRVLRRFHRQGRGGRDVVDKSEGFRQDFPAAKFPLADDLLAGASPPGFQQGKIVNRPDFLGGSNI